MIHRFKFLRVVLPIILIFGGTMTGCYQRNQIKDVGNSYSAGLEENPDNQKHYKAIMEAAADTAKKQIDEKLVIPGATVQMNEAGYWIDRTIYSQMVIMDLGEIKRFNENILKKVPQVCDFRNYKESISKEKLIEYIDQYKIPTKAAFTDGGAKADNSFYSELIKNCNVQALKDRTQVLYGVVVRKTNLRAFPSDKGAYDTNASYRIDRLQEASAEPCEGVVVLHCSMDKEWLFIQTVNYRAWVKAEDIALSNDRQEILDYMETPKFLMVTGNHIETVISDGNKTVSKVEFAMGARIPLADCTEITSDYLRANRSYLVKLPLRNQKGELSFEDILISMDEDVHEGYLPYTRENIILQAFKLLGDPYDWGNKFNGRDCSGFGECIYKTFGFKLPRNSGEQENLPGFRAEFNGEDNLEARNEKLDNLKAGALIFMKGHEMIYLGKVDGKHYMIHDFAGYGKKKDEEYEFVPVYAVAVTPAELALSDGTPYIMRFTCAIQLDRTQ